MMAILGRILGIVLFLTILFIGWAVVDSILSASENKLVGWVFTAILILGIVSFGRYLYLNYFGKSTKEHKELKQDNWESLQYEKIEKNFSPGKKGRNEGSNNSPISASNRICATEGEVIKYVKSHYANQIKKIKAWGVEGTNQNLQEVFRDSKRAISRNGYHQEYNKLKSEWESKLRHYVVRVKAALKDREEAREAVRTYKIQNNIIAGRHPQVHKKTFQIMKIMIPFFLFSVEIALNITGLLEVISGSEAVITAVMVSCINVGLSFSVGFLVLTHLFNPVGTSKSKIFYSIVLVLFGSVLVYINCMMGVFRASTEIANSIDLSNLSEAQAQAENIRITSEAMFAAVYPFDDLNKITFSGSFLMLVGFFFSFVSLLDGYFIKDPIPGFGKLGQARHDTEKRAEKLKNHESMVFTKTEEAELARLNTKHESRIEANETWKFYTDQLQILVEQFENFNQETKSVLESAMQSYREQNLKYRTTPAPIYFENAPDFSFIKSFADTYPHLADEFRTDEEIETIGMANEEKIDSEYRDMHEKYIQFFRDEKEKLFDIVENIDD
jgi:hypothetical protein